MEIQPKKIFADSCTIGPNPSKIGGCYIVNDEFCRTLSKRIINRPMTNNEINLLAVLRATELAEPGDIISTNSQTVLWWIKKGEVGARPDLKDLAAAAHKNMKKNKLQLVYQSRRLNVAESYIECRLCQKR
jgi:hypothetical protein